MRDYNILTVLLLSLTLVSLLLLSLNSSNSVSVSRAALSAASGQVNDFGSNPISIPSDDWIRTYGSSAGEFGEAIIKTSDSGYIAAGNSNGDFYVVKMDANGDVTCFTCWQKIYGAANHEYLNSIVEVNDGYVLAGFTNNPLLEDILVIKIDKAGGILWQRTFGVSDRRDFGHRIAKTSDGGFVVLGGSAPSGSNGVTRLWLIKLDASGNKLWDKSYGNARGVEDIETGNIEETNYGYIIGSTTYVSKNKGADFWVLKLDPNGNILKEVVVGKPRPAHEILTDIHQTSDGGYITAGYTTDNSLNALTSGWAVKFDADLNVVWQKAYGITNTPTFSAYQSFQNVREVLDGYVFAGTIHLPASTTYDNEDDFWLVKTDFNGDTGHNVNYWQKTYGAAQNDELRYMSLTTDGFVMAGWTQRLPKLSSNYDMLLIKIKGPGSFPCLVKKTLGLQAIITNALTDIASSNVLSNSISGGPGPATQANANGVMADLCK